MGSDEKLRGGQILARALQDKGIEQVYTLSGGFCNAILGGLMECGINVINAPHEQVAGFLTDGYTRINRKPAVCLVGPEGFANAVGSMIESWGERTPIIYITSSSTLRRRGAGGFKELDDVAIAAPLTKMSVGVTDGVRIREIFDHAYKVAIGGYPGPVHISIPVDLTFDSFPADAGLDERPYSWAPEPAQRPWPNPAALDPILDNVANAKKPVFVVGHGVWWSEAEKKLEQVASELGIPVFNMSENRKMISQSSPAYMGLAESHEFPPSGDALSESDVILAVGTVLDNTLEFGNAPLFPKSAKLIAVNGSDEEILFNHAADQVLLCDPGAFFDALLNLKSQDRWNLDPQWLETNRQRRVKWADDALANLVESEAKLPAIHPLRVSLDVQSLLGANDWLIYDGGNTHFWAEIGVNIAGSRGQELAGIVNVASFSMLGVGIPFGIAAKMSHPDSTVVVISGDGAFMCGGMSIELAFQENVPIVVVVDNNMGLDCISEQQERMYPGGVHFATDFRDIPFHEMVIGLGGYGELVTDRADLAPAIERAIASGKPAVVNVKTKGVITPLIENVTMKRDSANIE
jgi:acetolactate synthase-1/2/3 large subunit